MIARRGVGGPWVGAAPTDAHTREPDRLLSKLYKWHASCARLRGTISCSARRHLLRASVASRIHCFSEAFSGTPNPLISSRAMMHCHQRSSKNCSAYLMKIWIGNTITIRSTMHTLSK